MITISSSLYGFGNLFVVATFTSEDIGMPDLSLAFATFFLLSYVKFFSVTVSFALLIPVNLHNVHGNSLNQTYVYYNATINYLGEQHLPYAILAITVLILFTILPILLLCLNPRQCIQKFLNFCGQRCAVLHTFMDTFQDCYIHE